MNMSKLIVATVCALSLNVAIADDPTPMDICQGKVNSTYNNCISSAKNKCHTNGEPGTPGYRCFMKIKNKCDAEKKEGSRKCYKDILGPKK